MLLDRPTVLDAWALPDQTASELAQWAPQASLIEILDEVSPAALSMDGQIDALLAVQRHVGLLHAREAEPFAACRTRPPTKPTTGTVATEPPGVIDQPRLSTPVATVADPGPPPF
jgi:hypothetical protein